MRLGFGTPITTGLLARHQVNLFDAVQDLTEQALETVAEMLESEDSNVRMRAALAILRVAEPGRVPKGLRGPPGIQHISTEFDT